MAVYRYMPAQPSREAAERWCLEHHCIPVALEVGPDGLVRGLVEEEQCQD